MNAIAQFNQLGGKTVSRKDLEDLKILAYQEGCEEIIIRIDNVLDSNPEASGFKLELEKPVIQFALGAAWHFGLYREALDECGRLQKGYKFENGHVVKVATGQSDKKKFKKASVKQEVVKEAKKASNYGKKRPFIKKSKSIQVVENTESEKNNFDFIYEVGHYGNYYIKSFLELPTSRSVKFEEISSTIENLRYYKATTKGLNDLKANFKGLYGDKQRYGSEVLFNPKEKPYRTKKNASNYGKKRKYESVKSKYTFSKDDIPYQTAYNAHTGTSFSPEKRAKSEQNEYYSHLEQVFKSNRKKAIQLGKLDEFDAKFERYKNGYLKKFLEHLRSKIGFYSTMIAGPSNFPVRRMEKKSNVINAKLNELIDYQKYAEFFKPESNIIKTGSETALSKLEEKLKIAEDSHARMLAGNKLLKKLRADKNATESDYKEAFINLGFDLATAKKEANYMFKYDYASFFTTNSSAKIRNIKKQIILEKRLKEKATVEPEGEITFDGGTIVDDYSDNRIKIYFDNIPDQEVRSFLKKAGQAFKWSPKNKAWQRQLNTYYRGSRADLYRFLNVTTPEPTKKKVSDEGGNYKTEIITDKSEVQKYKNSIAEGEEILRAGKFNGKIKTFNELQAVLRSVNNSRKKIGLPPTDIEIKEKKVSDEKNETNYNNYLITKTDDGYKITDSTNFHVGDRKTIDEAKNLIDLRSRITAVTSFKKKQKNSNIETLELSKITLDPKRFQNRTKLNENIVKNIVNNFNETELDPLILWKNKGKNYLLAGHHRFEALSTLKKKTAPVKFFTGTEAEAVEFAKVKSNSNRSLETPIERAKIYREMKGTKKNIEEKAKEIEGKNASYILNLSALNPKGILIESLEKLSTGDKQNASLLEKIADWIGDVKRTYSNLTNAHEKEMFDFLMNKDDSKRISTKADFRQKIYAIVGTFDFDNSQPLNLKRFKYQTEGEKVYENEYNELKTKVSDAVQKKADLIDRLSNVKRQDFIPADDDSSVIAAKKLAEMTAEIARLQKQLIELSQSKGTYTGAGQNQAALFGTFSVPTIYKPEIVKHELQPQVKNGLMDMEFDSLEMDEGWENLMQDPARNMKIAIWGKPKNGKTSGALQLANYLTKFGNVIYNFVDQGFNKSTQNLWSNSGLATKPNATPTDITSSKDLEKELKTGKYTFCFIDMISDWIRTEKMKPEEFKERFMRQFPEVSFILIFEVTKSGDFKGDQGWTHLVDAIMTVEDFIIENRGRYGMGEKIVWEEGAAKFNPKRFAELQSNLVPEQSETEEEENIFSEEIEIL